MKRLLSCITLFSLLLLLTGCASAAASPSSDTSLVQPAFTPSATDVVGSSANGLELRAFADDNKYVRWKCYPRLVFAFSSWHQYQGDNPKTNANPAPAQQPVSQQSAPAPAPTPTQAPAPAATSTATPAPAPTPMPDGAPANPWGYDFEPGNAITAPPSNFCSYYNCIANFSNGKGYVEECKDSTYSKSGGVSGSCSGHSGNNRELYSH